MDSHERESCTSGEAHRVATIRDLNDRLRRDDVNGKLFVTDGICRLKPGTMNIIIAAVAAFDDFSTDNDPHDEHDFGTLNVEGERISWKIDYYDQAMDRASLDPSNPHLTTRVLTIMLGSEY